VFLKTHRIFKDGKHHIYYSLFESLRVSRGRVLQRRVLHLGELNTTQLERWQRTIEVVEEDGRRPPNAALYRPARQSVTTAAPPEDVAEVLLSSLVVGDRGSSGLVG
jgi:DNA-binding SARP family transcriptional activator